MNKPRLIDYVEIPLSTSSGANYNYQKYSIALEKYIEFLEIQYLKINNTNC